MKCSIQQGAKGETGPDGEKVNNRNKHSQGKNMMSLLDFRQKFDFHRGEQEEKEGRELKEKRYNCHYCQHTSSFLYHEFV